jgi:hypothetical protein
MKLIIAGTRTFNDIILIEKSLEHLVGEITEVVSGNARGADKLGEAWAKEHGIPVKIFEANWQKFGKTAGFIRNEHMAKYGDSLVVFWDGESKGTYNMIYQMRKLSKPVEIVFYDNDSPEG